jgi:hypothetical protein
MRIKNINIVFDINDYASADYDRMFLYIWEDEDADDECKFGERWVKAGQDPVQECAKRIYNSLGVRKDRAKEDAKISMVAVFDVTKAAKTVDRYYAQSRMDDFIREQIGFRKGATGEVHTLSGQDMKGRVADVVKAYGAELIEAGLSTKQYNVAIEVLEAFTIGMRIILAELCARFGKTIWSGAVATETDANLIIVASYVKTVFTSFANDLKMFNQFADYVHVDTGSDDYQEKITQALAIGKKVFVYLSLCNGGKRQKRIDYLFNINAKRMLIIDEADFGAHTKNQADVLVKKVKADKDCKVIIMTGTNADRAVTHWQIDTVVSVTYPELLVQKTETKQAA